MRSLHEQTSRLSSVGNTRTQLGPARSAVEGASERREQPAHQPPHIPRGQHVFLMQAFFFFQILLHNTNSIFW